MAVNIDNIQPYTKRSKRSEEDYILKKITFPNKVNYDYDKTFSQSLFALSNITDVSDFQSINVRGTVLKKID